MCLSDGFWQSLCCALFSYLTIFKIKSENVVDGKHPVSSVSLVTMENCGTVRAADANQETTRRELMSTKPLHRFVQMEPRSLGVAIINIQKDRYADTYLSIAELRFVWPATSASSFRPEQIVILILGCTELLMGFQQADGYRRRTSRFIYVPFWQGTLVVSNVSYWHVGIIIQYISPLYLTA